MAKFRVQRMYADNDPNNPGQEKKSGMGLGTKILAGTAALGAGLTAAKFGAFGAKAQIGVNKQLMNVGRTFNSEALMNFGAKGIAQGKFDIQKKGLEKIVNTSTDGVTGEALEKLNMKKNAAQNVLNKFNTEAGANTRLEQLKQGALKDYGVTPTPATPAPAATTAFSDTKQDLREAALLGTGLVTTGTGLYLAKKGKLGVTKKQRGVTKKAYDKAVAKIKGWYKEAERGGNKAPQGATNTAGGASEAGKKPFYSKEDKKAAEKYAKENGLSSWQEAAEKLGFKPESYK